MDLEKVAFFCGLFVVLAVLILSRASGDADWRDESQLASKTSVHPHVLLSGWMNLSDATATHVRFVSSNRDADDSAPALKGKN